MKPTATRVKKLVERFEQDVMNPALEMIDATPDSEDWRDETTEALYEIRLRLMLWYQALQETTS